MKIWNTIGELIEWLDHHHNPMHENGGVDEIDVTGLSGLLADEQHALATEIDYGLSFQGVVTTATDTTHFKVSTLADKGTGFFKPTAGSPYEIYVVEADGAAPEGEQTPVVAYTTADGTFQHAEFTAQLAVGDIVLIQHPVIAMLGTKATAAAEGAVTTTDYLIAYIKQLVTLLIAQDVVVDNLHDTDIPAIKTVVDAITAAGPTNTQMETARDAVIAAIPAMVGTNSAMLAVNGALEATLTAIKGGGWTDETLKAIKDAVDAIAPGDATEAKQDAIIADTEDIQTTLGTPANFMANVASLALEATLGTHDTDIKTLLSTIAGYIDTEIAAITAAGPTLTQMNTAHALLATPAQVATALDTYDAIKRSEATSDKEAVIAAIPAMVGTDNAATEAKQDIIDTNVDDIEVLVDSKVMGRLQVATTTWDLKRGDAGAGTDVLFTGTTQAVILESLIVRMPTTSDVTDDGTITSMAIATDDAEPGIIIAAADAPVASMTPESQFGWTGTLYIPVDTEIEGTLAGGDADAECLVIVTATYRAVVSGGYLA